jgi:hypothetical protein
MKTGPSSAESHHGNESTLRAIVFVILGRGGIERLLIAGRNKESFHPRGNPKA